MVTLFIEIRSVFMAKLTQNPAYFFSLIKTILVAETAVFRTTVVFYKKK